MLKIPFFTLGILINVLFYSCSAVSRIKHVTCRTGDRHIYGNYKLSPWKTIEFRLHFKRRKPKGLYLNPSKGVTCTGSLTTRKYITKSCTNWHFSRRKKIKFRMDCQDVGYNSRLND